MPGRQTIHVCATVLSHSSRNSPSRQHVHTPWRWLSDSKPPPGIMNWWARLGRSDKSVDTLFNKKTSRECFLSIRSRCCGVITEHRSAPPPSYFYLATSYCLFATCNMLTRIFPPGLVVKSQACAVNASSAQYTINVIVNWLVFLKYQTINV